MNEIGISVIVPVFNLEEYIGECLESILKQTFQNIEIIVVDDNSSDGSVKVIEQFARKDSRIKMILLDKNHGAGHARNVGMQSARGDYLMFLDGDDFFSTDMLEKLYSMCEKYSADIAVCNAYMHDHMSGKNDLFDETSRFQFDKIGVPFHLKEIAPYAFQFMHEMAWNKLFRRKLVLNTGVKFQEQHNANDEFFVFAFLMSAANFVMLPEPLVYYRTNVQGQLSKSIPKSPKCIYDATLATVQFMETHNWRTIYKRGFNTYIINRLIFSMDMLEGSVREAIFNFYHEKGLRQLGMENCKLEDFLNYIEYQQYLVMRNNAYSEYIYERLRPEINWKSQSLKRALEKLKRQNKNVVLWGAGIRGKKLLDRLETFGFQLTSVVDREREKVGCMLNQYKVDSIDTVDNGDVILVTNRGFIEDIKSALADMDKDCILIDMQTLLSYETEVEEVVIA
mgnify:FL=1